MKKVIRFSKNFYSLYEVTEWTFKGSSFDKVYVIYTYAKKISRDKAVALAKYPGVELDESYPGMCGSFSVFKSSDWNNVNQFRFGKYKYEIIDNCQDSDYISWYYDNIYGDHKKYVESILISRGFKAVNKQVETPCGFVINSRELQNVRQEEEFRDSYNWMIKHLNGETYPEITLDKNLDGNGEYIINFKSKNYRLTFKFNNYKTYYYGDAVYSLPKIKGVGKRIKNKPIKLINFIIKGHVVEVKEFAMA